LGCLGQTGSALFKSSARKGLIQVARGNQKRAITLLQAASALKASLANVYALKTTNCCLNPNKSSRCGWATAELLSLLLGRVAAGRPIEALDHDELRSSTAMVAMRARATPEGEGTP